MSEAPRPLQFWTNLARLGKPCEPSRFPDKDGNTTCLNHDAVIPEGSTECTRARPLRDPKLSAREEPTQLGLFEVTELPHG